MRGAEGSGLTAVQPLKCHPDKARNQLEDNTNGTLAHKQHKHSCRAVRRCWLQPPERCIIHARPTKRERVRVWTYVSLHVSVQHALFFFEGRKSVEVKGKGWSHLTASLLEKFIKKTAKNECMSIIFAPFPFPLWQLHLHPSVKIPTKCFNNRNWSFICTMVWIQRVSHVLLSHILINFVLSQ